MTSYIEEEVEEQDIKLGSGFDDEGLNSALNFRSDVKLTTDVIQIDAIVTSHFKKVGRDDSLIGLKGVIGEWGVVSPIHVLQLEDDNQYMILDGLRRLFGSARNGNKDIKAVVWNFSDKEEGKEMANVISLMLNRSQRFTAKEMWKQLLVLEEVNGASPGLIEFLLQMQSGDAMKLKDIMLSDDEYMEIRSDLMSNILTIEGAYKKLCAERKKENRLAKEDSLVLDTHDTTMEDVSDEQQLSVDDVKDLLDLSDKDVSDSSLDDLDRTSEARDGYNVQDVNDRKPIDPKIKQAVMIRDGFRCRCCDLGGHAGWAGILVYHHVIPVFLGGEDSERNGICICSNCHISLHLYSFGKISVVMDDLDEAEQKIFRNIFKFGNIIIEGMKRSKVTSQEGYKADAGSRRHLYPGEGLKDNKEAFANAPSGDKME